jgi:hypothetical protein
MTRLKVPGFWFRSPAYRLPRWKAGQATAAYRFKMGPDPCVTLTETGDTRTDPGAARADPIPARADPGAARTGAGDFGDCPKGKSRSQVVGRGGKEKKFPEVGEKLLSGSE